MPESWSNWSGSASARPRRIERPVDESGLVHVVRSAAAAREPLRVVGTGHSFSPIAATDGCLVSLDDDTGIESIDTEARTATLRAGTKLHDLGEPLRAAGLAMRNMGDIDVQSVAGAISTGTHGTGPTLANLSSQIDGLRLVTAAGERVECSAELESGLFEMARVSIGVLGVISAVRLRLVPAYRLHERIWQEDCDAALEALEERISATRHFEFFWFPRSDRCEQKALHPAPHAPTGPLPDGERIDWSDRVLPSVRDVKFFEMEYSVPEERGLECFRELRTLLRAKHPDVVWPVEYRTLARDDIPLSNAYERETVTISVHRDGRKPYEAVMRDAESLFRNYGGRPHWGKLHGLRYAELRTLYPRFEEFCALRRTLDPDDVFLTPYLASLLEPA